MYYAKPVALQTCIHHEQPVSLIETESSIIDHAVSVEPLFLLDIYHLYLSLFASFSIAWASLANPMHVQHW